ncbi:hypothetical protein EIK77_002318 [Talaromyces pinophilus]|nr:hypothetical protein EIK77_002318 [Talaromyces pinophilus]PCG93721.1 hypothetical protein PENOC_086160 [Penicillium occitanis (nom. inval.)]PCG94354.1 Nucleoside phosphorylase [Penicillium occitanis (nom. inval.)]
MIRAQIQMRVTANKSGLSRARQPYARPSAPVFRLPASAQASTRFASSQLLSTQLSAAGRAITRPKSQVQIYDPNPIIRRYVNEKLCADSYTVGWICALKPELDAALNALDQIHGWVFGHESDHNLYALGRIGEHCVAITCLAMGKYGNNAAAMVATRMMSTFSNIKIGLNVGIGGGLPSEKDDIRLGDVVVGKPNMQHGGILQYDMGKFITHGFQTTGFLPLPPERLLAALNMMPSHGAVLPSPLSVQYPGEKYDRLFKSDYEHMDGSTCERCDEQKLVKRGPGRRKYGPRVFYGTVASGNAVIKDPTTRDNLVRKHAALCFEMEAAGLVNSNFPCLAIRGISDYADSHKNDIWQKYAAAAAAQFAKDFLRIVPVNI